MHVQNFISIYNTAVISTLLCSSRDITTFTLLSPRLKKTSPLSTLRRVARFITALFFSFMRLSG